MQGWVPCRAGFRAGLGSVQGWVPCRAGFRAGLGSVQGWVPCKCVHYSVVPNPVDLDNVIGVLSTMYYTCCT